MATNRYAGVVVEKSTQVGIAGLTIEAVDLRGKIEGPVAGATTDSAGAFELQVSDEVLADLASAGSLIVFLRVKSSQNVLASTEATHRWSVRRSVSGARIEVEAARPLGADLAATKYLVSGIVTNIDTGPVSGAIVSVHARGLGAGSITETLLGTGTSSANGHYKVSYEPGTATAPDLAVSASVGGSNVAKATVCRAPARARVDLVVNGEKYLRDPGRVRYQVVTSAVDPLCIAPVGGAQALTTEQMELVACKTGIPYEEVDALRLASQLNVAHPTISREVFYAFMRKGIAGTSDDVFSHRIPSLQRMLEEAMLERTIASTVASTANWPALKGALETAALATLRLTGGNKLRLGALLLGTAWITTSDQRDGFVKKALNHEGTSDAFWAAIDADSLFDFPDARPHLRMAVEVGSISGAYAPMASALLALVESDDLPADPKELVKYEAADWDAIIAGLPGVPEGTPTTPGTPEENYRNALMKSAESRYRTARIKWRVSQDEAPTSALRKFFDSVHNPTFDFAQKRVGRYLIENTNALTGLTAPEQTEVVKRLRDIERIFKVTSSWAEASTLLTAGLTSSYAIHQKGRDKFTAEFGSMGALVASGIFDQACWRASTSAAMRIKYDRRLDLLKLPVLADKTTKAVSLPAKIGDWDTLFGTLNQCKCEHCRSVLGPAAYLVDMLELCDRVSATSGTAKTQLLNRRPDLKQLALSCENAHTPLPYIDVVNEVMEVRLAASSWPSWPASPNPVDTVPSADELAAQPEVLYPSEHIAAYTALEAAVFPMHLPFHLWQEEARIYLDHLQVSRAELLELLASDAAGPNARHLALERLRTAARQYDIIALPTLAVINYWGLTSWPGSVLASMVMEKTALSYDELRELFATQYCFSNTIRFTPTGSCDLATLTVDGLTDDTRRHFLHRMVRLSSVLGTSLTETDRVIRAFAPLDATALPKIAGLVELSQRTKRSLTELCSWFADLDTHKEWETPPFRLVFLNARTLAPAEQAFETVFSTGSSSATIASVATALVMALQISDADLRRLTDATTAAAEMALLPIVSSTATLTLANLSRLHRVAHGTRTLNLSILDWWVLREFTGAKSLSGDEGVTATPADTLAFLDQLERFRETGLSASEAHYILRHVATKESGLEPTEAQLTQWDAELLADLEKHAAESAEVKDPHGQTVKNLGALLWPGQTPSAEEQLADLVDGTHSDPSALITALTPFLGDAADATAKLVTSGGSIKELDERHAYLAQRFTRYNGSASLVKSWVSRTFGVDQDVARVLLESGVIKHGAVAAVRAFIPTLAWTTPSSTTTERKNLYELLHKSGLLVERLRLDARDLAALYPGGVQDPGGLPFLDLNALPLAPPSVAAAFTANERARFATLLRLSDLIWVRDRYAAGAEAFYATLTFAASGALGDIEARVAIENNLVTADVTELGSAFALNTAAEYRKEHVYFRLFRAAEALRRTGASAAQAKGWLLVESALPVNFTDAGPNALTIAREIKKVARAKHSDTDWTKIARNLRDPLRDKQRRALVGALLPKIGVATTDQLFEKLLIDVEMSPCALTSRLVSAHGSVQTFVNRILLNLESSAITPTRDLASEWEWMRNYRVWEANRKVFLWPENWIEPELRGDKTPEFEALETALLQGPITHDNAEAAYRKYLDDLADVANLEIVALHVEKGAFFVLPGASSYVAVHVIGRTKKPHRHYHRKKTKNGWTPWRKIDADIQGDHVVPVTFGGRLYLFWALMEDFSRPADPVVAVTTPEEELITDEMIEAAPEQSKPFLAQAQAQQEQALAQQAADAEALSTQRPQSVATRVSLTFAELRSGQWTSSSLVSTPVQLNAAPVRSLLHFQATTSGNRIEVTMLMSMWEVGHFRFNVGTAAFHGAARNYLVDPGGGYPAQCVPTVVKSKTNANWASQTQLTVPDATNIEFQAFDTVSNKLRLYMVEGNDAIPAARVLDKVNKATRIVVSRGVEPAKERSHLVVQDSKRAFFLELDSRKYKPSSSGFPSQVLGEFGDAPASSKEFDKFYRVQHLYHPYVNDFRARMARHGLDGLLRPVALLDPKPQYQEADITSNYLPYDQNVTTPFPKERVEFGHGSPYGVYNWELFFHAPLLIATRLMQEGRHDEARKWFHLVFDPTDGATPATATDATRYWKFKPFADNKNLADIQTELAGSVTNAYAEEMVAWGDAEALTPPSVTLSAQIATWRDDPFDPHAIARLRVVAYQKAVVQKYIENLIAWGDQLFSQDSIESINEATQLYLLASSILGPRPTLIPDPTPDAVQSYDQLDVTSAFDAFSNALIDAEVVAPDVPKDGSDCAGGATIPSTVYGSPYFCVPHNEKLISFWDTIADRLFKIRHCQNIEGVVRALPLYQPPIDPALLVRARAAGLDLSSVLNDLAVSAPPYRYAILAARALEYTNAVTNLGSALLSAIEKKDAEELAQLRAGHDVANLDATREIRKQQLQEAKENLEATNRSLRSAEERLSYYDSRDFISPGEVTAQVLGGVAEALSATAQTVKTGGSQSAWIPDFIGGTAGIASPVTLNEFGGSNAKEAAFGAADALSLGASAARYGAGLASTLAEYQRRMDDWKHQARLARLEIAQIEKQIVAAEIRVAVAQHELNLVNQQLKQNKDVERFLRTKFSNKDLYGWMKGQLAATYYQSYKLAFEMARRAEKAFHFERSAGTDTFIKFGYWDGLRQGLLAGERLAQDLRRMDSAYHSQNKREYELTKTISLATLAPLTFMQIREGVPVAQLGGFSLKESHFDDDFPTHHLRRVKSANVSVHCTPGPYQSVNGKLTLLNAQTRKTATSSTLDTLSGVVSSIATSMGQNDHGMFELNFRDDRYLPFEGAGAHLETGDQWRFELMAGNEFPFDSISDVVFQLRYTAREGRSPAPTAITSPKHVLWRVPHAFPDAWQAFVDGASTIDLVVTPDRLPKGRNRNHQNVTQVIVWAKWSGSPAVPAVTNPANGAVSMGGATPVGTVAPIMQKYESGALTQPLTGTQFTWKFAPQKTGLLDFWVAFSYSLT